MWPFAKCLNPLQDFSLAGAFFLTRKQVMANIMTLFILQFTFLWSLFVATDLSYLAQRGNPKDKLFWRLVNWINIMFWKKKLKRRVDFLEIVNLGIFQENNNASMQFPKCLSLSEHYVTLWKIWKRVVTVWKLRKFSLAIFCKNFVKLPQLVQYYTVCWFHEIFCHENKIQ